MSFKRNDNGEVLCRINVIDDGLLTSEFLRHLGERHRCINGRWFLAAHCGIEQLCEMNAGDRDAAIQLEAKLDVPEREVERCMSTIRKAGLKVENEGRIDANTDVPEHVDYYELLSDL
jgi:hypothetical protein